MRQSRAQYQDGRAHGFDQIIRCAQFVQSAAIDVEHADAVGRHGRAHAFEQFVRGFHVAQHRYIGQTQGFFGEQSRTHQRQGSVFGARNGDFAIEWAIGVNS